MAQAIHPERNEDQLCAELIGGSRQGDWNAILRIVDDLCRVPPPPTSAGIHDRARVLEEALTAAKATRADLAASLVRLTAAGRFSNCQENAGSPGF